MLKMMRFKLRLHQAKSTKTARAVAKVAGKAMMKGIDKVSKGVDKAIEMKEAVDEKYMKAKKAAYKNFVPAKVKDMIENPIVSGTAVPPIDHIEPSRIRKTCL